MNSKIIKQRDYKAVNFVLQDVNLEFILDDINTSVINKMKFTNVKGEICLDGIDLELISISINDKISSDITGICLEDVIFIILSLDYYFIC